MPADVSHQKRALSADLTHQKRALRAELRERRRNLTSTERTAASEGFTERLIELVRSIGATSVSAYLSSSDEPAACTAIRIGAGRSRHAFPSPI